jgi:uncharacterized LabA/DUF88 family protein
MPESKRVMIFIDGSNFYHSLKSTRSTAQIDFKYLIEKLTGDRTLVRAYYYNSPVNQVDDLEKYKRQQSFFTMLKKSVDYLEIKLGRLEKRDGKIVEKGVDVKLAVDMVIHAAQDTYDTAILISGDGDFADAVNFVKNRGKHLELAYPDQQCYNLKQICDKFILLNNEYCRNL